MIPGGSSSLRWLLFFSLLDSCPAVLAYLFFFFLAGALVLFFMFLQIFFWSNRVPRWPVTVDLAFDVFYQYVFLCHLL